MGAIALARAAGAATIIAFDVSPARCASALALGADEAHDPRKLAEEGSSPAEEVRRLTRGWGADLLVEAAGAALHTMPQIERAMAPGAQMIYLAAPASAYPSPWTRWSAGRPPSWAAAGMAARAPSAAWYA